MLEWVFSTKNNNRQGVDGECSDTSCKDLLDACTDFSLMSRDREIERKFGSCDSCNAVAGNQQTIRYI